VFHNAPSTVHAQHGRNIPAHCEIVRNDVWQRIGNGAGEALIKGIGFGFLGAAADRIGRTGGTWTNVGLSAGAGIGFLEGSADQYTMVCHQQQSGSFQQGLPAGGSHSQGAVTRFTCNPRVNGQSFVLQVRQNTFCPELESAMLLAASSGQPVQAILGGVRISGQNFEMVSSAQMVQSVINLMARTIGGTPPSAQQPTQQSHEVFTPTGTNPPEINQTCYVKAPEGTYRFNTVDGVKIGRNDCQAIMKGEKTLPPLTSLSIVL
jgi:hypothetical protein